MAINKVFGNALWVACFQAANYLIPIILIPIVINGIGNDAFGRVSYIQSIATYALIFCNICSDYAVIREISVNRDNTDKITSLFWGTVALRTILVLVVGIVFFSYSLFDCRSVSELSSYAGAFVFSIGMALYPVWFFQGIEKMSVMGISNFLIKITGAVPIILFVTSPKDASLYLWLYSLPYLIAAVIMIFYVKKEYLNNKILVRREDMKNILTTSLPIFMSYLFSSSTPNLAMTIVGKMDNEVEIGQFSIAFKLIFVILTMSTMPISMAIYPNIAQRYKQSLTEGIKYFYKALWFVLGIGCLISILTYVLTPFVINIYLGSGNERAIEILRTYSLCPLVCNIALFCTNQGFFATNRQKYAILTSLVSFFVCLVVSLITIERIGVSGGAIGYTVCQIIESILAFTILFFLNKKIINSGLE